jgi:hypothetical protein
VLERELLCEVVDLDRVVDDELRGSQRVDPGRAGVKAISCDGSSVGTHFAIASMCSPVTFSPSSVRSRFSSRIFSEYGSRATSKSD